MSQHSAWHRAALKLYDLYIRIGSLFILLANIFEYLLLAESSPYPFTEDVKGMEGRVMSLGAREGVNTGDGWDLALQPCSAIETEPEGLVGRKEGGRDGHGEAQEASHLR